jgi:hypothetical protein
MQKETIPIGDGFFFFHELFGINKLVPSCEPYEVQGESPFNGQIM